MPKKNKQDDQTRFRFNARKVFLTYSAPLENPEATNLELDEFVRHFQEMLRNKGKPTEQFCIAREQHENGHFHFHCLAVWGTKVDTINERFFDLLGIHPNIQAPHSIKDVHNYIHKGGEYTCKLQSYWVLACEAPTHGEALSIIKEHNPRTFLLEYEKISRNLQAMHKPGVVRPPLQPPQLFRAAPANVASWCEQHIAATLNPDTDRYSVLVIVGPSRVGKSTWARSLGKHITFAGDWNLSDWSNDTNYIILDDIPWEKIERVLGRAFLTNSALGAAVVTDKYHAKRTITPRPTIITWNEDMFNASPFSYDAYWKLNSVVWTVTEKLY